MSSFEEVVAELNHIAVEFDSAAAHVIEKIAKITIATGYAIEANAKVIVPVDTGALRESIGTTITREAGGAGISVEIGTDLEYGPWVEFGTARMAPRAFLGPSLDRYSGAWAAAIEAAADPLASRL